MELIYLLFSCPQLCAHNCVWHLNCVRQCALTIATQDNPADLWQLRHWLQFLQLRTWIHDNLCYLTIKSDTGQHSQFLRCFYHGAGWSVDSIQHNCTTGSSRKNVKSKSVCTGVNFHKKWFLWSVLGWKIAANLPYRASRTITITLRHPY